MFKEVSSFVQSALDGYKVRGPAYFHLSVFLPPFLSLRGVDVFLGLG